MKKEFQYLAISLFLVVIVSLLFGSSGPEPYSGSELFSKEYVYEGIDEDIPPIVEQKEEEKKEETFANQPFPEGMANQMEADKKEKAPSMISSIASIFGKPEVKDEKKKENMFGLDQAYASVQGMFKPPAKKEEGFSLSPAEFASQPLNDKFAAFADVSTANTSAGTSCMSGGLSTSRGPLCLSPELMEILRTRGGNATSK